MSKEVVHVRKGKCPICKQPSRKILYKGEPRINHNLAKDTKLCRAMKNG